MSRRLIVVLVLLLTLGSLSGCKLFGFTSREERLRQELMALSKEEAFESGKELISRGKWNKGRKYLIFVHENYPGDPISRAALLRLADSYFEEGSLDALTEALFRYRDYQSRFPGRPESDYVMMRVADCQLLQVKKGTFFLVSPPYDLDLEGARKALQQYQMVLRQYPDSLRRDEILDKIRDVRDLLARHELSVGRFYYRRGFYTSSLDRLSGLLEAFPDFSSSDEGLYWAIRAADRLGKVERAEFFLGRIEAEYPDSEWTEKARDLDLGAFETAADEVEEDADAEDATPSEG